MIRYTVGAGLNETAIRTSLGYKYLTVHGSFDQEQGDKFEKDFFEAVDTGQPIVPILISSYGGAADQLDRMIDLMETSPVPIATIANGVAMSCGVLLLAAGTEDYRWAAKASSIMVHDITCGSWGKIEDMIADAKASERYRRMVYHRFDTHTGHNRGYWMKKMKELGNVDLSLTAKQAQAEGIIDHIGVPRLTISVEMSVDIG